MREIDDPLIVGNLGGSLRSGRYIRLPQNNPTVFGRDRQFCGVPHTQMLSSLWAGMELGELDFGQAAMTGSVITSHQTWYFQMWHRDHNGSSNFSNGLRVMFP